MRITLDEWMGMQGGQAKVCEGPEPTIPKVVFIGVRQEDGTIESHMRLVAASEWEVFQQIWRKISGMDGLEGRRPRQAPQFFLI